MILELENLLADQETLVNNWLEFLLIMKRKHSLVVERRKKSQRNKNENKDKEKKENDSQPRGTCQGNNRK